MELFARTFLPAAADAGLDMPAIGRHLPLFRRCLGTESAVLFVTRATRPDRSTGEYLLAATRHRLVVAHESRMVHRVRLHLDAPLHELFDVSWSADRAGTCLELAATAIDGIRERFVIRPRRTETVWQLGARLDGVFGPAPTGRLVRAA